MTAPSDVMQSDAYSLAVDLIAAGTDTRDNITHLLAWYGCRVAGIPTDELAEAVKVQHRAAEREAVARAARLDVQARVARRAS